MQSRIISEEQFRQKAKTWLNHKMILANASQWYKEPKTRSAIAHVKTIFNQFLALPSNYNVCQLAVQIKKHEDLLMAILPMPGNPSYENAFATLSQLIKYSTDLIQQHQLQHLIK